MDSRVFRGQRYSIYKYIYIYYIFAVVSTYIRKSKTLFGYFVIWLLRGVARCSFNTLIFHSKHLLSSNLHSPLQNNKVHVRPPIITFCFRWHDQRDARLRYATRTGFRLCDPFRRWRHRPFGSARRKTLGNRERFDREKSNNIVHKDIQFVPATLLPCNPVPLQLCTSATLHLTPYTLRFHFSTSPFSGFRSLQNCLQSSL